MNIPVATNYIHQGLFFTSPDELLTTAVPALREGFAAGDAVILACRDEHNALLADVLGPYPRITALSPDRIYTRAATAAETYRRLVGKQVAAGARRVWVVGELDNFRAGTDGWTECERYESITNAALAACPLTTICVWDMRRLPPAVVEDLLAAHPFVLTPAGRVRNERYVDPVSFLRRCRSGPDPVEQSSPAVEFGPLTELRQVADLRDRLRAALDTPAADPRVTVDVVAAVHEVVVNGLVHGSPPVRVRLWTPDGRLLCTVTDAGEGFDDPLAGYVRADGDDPFGPGAGLWLARQLCDRIEMARTVAGFTVRLSTSTRTAHPAADPG